MDPAISYHFGSHPLPPQAAVLSPYSVHPYQHSITPYSTIPNEYGNSQIYMLSPPYRVQPMVAIDPYYAPEEPSLFQSFLETFCCCFTQGPPQSHYEFMHREEMKRRRNMAKQEKYRRQQYQKALQEKYRLSQQMASTNAANNNTNTQTNAATTNENSS